MSKQYVYMLGIEPEYWTMNDTKTCKKYGVQNLGYYELGNNEGMILVGSLRQLMVLMEDYFEIKIVDEYLNEIDDFDYEDGRWVTGGWFNLKESTKSTKKSLKENIDDFNKAIAKKYNDTEPNSAGQYYLDWRFDLYDEKENIEKLADKYGVEVEFQSDEGYFEVFEESTKSTKKSLKESINRNRIEYDLTVLINNQGKILDPKVYPNFDTLVDEIEDFIKNM